MRIVILLVALLIASDTWAQVYPPITNASFEQWQPASPPVGPEQPVGWSINYSLPFGVTQVVPLVSKSSDAFDGQFSIVLRPVRAPQSPPMFPYSGEACELTYIDSSIRGPHFPKRLIGRFKTMRDLNNKCFWSPDTPHTSTCMAVMVSFFTNTPYDGLSSFDPPDSSATQWTEFSVNVDTPSGNSPVQYARIVFALTNKDASANPVAQVMIDGLRWDWGDTTASVETQANVSSESISMFPNPTTAVLSVRHTLGADASFTILDLQGRALQTGVLQNSQLSLEALAPGLYMLRLQGEKGCATRRFGKQ